MHNLGRQHWNEVNHIFRYLVGTQHLGILFGPNKISGIIGYIYLNFAICLDNGKSNIGHLFWFGNRAISWKSKLQECITTSTTEAEYVARPTQQKKFYGSVNWLVHLDKPILVRLPLSTLIVKEPSLYRRIWYIKTPWRISKLDITLFGIM